MINLILSLAIVAVLVIAFKYFTGKRKSHDEKSAMEKISGTIANGVSRSIDDLAEGMRDTKTVKKELLKAIDDNLRDLRSQYSEHFEALIRSRETYDKMRTSTMKRVESLTERIRNLKREFETNNNPEKKKQAEGLVGVLIEAKHLLKKNEDNLSAVKEKLEKSKNDYEIAVMRMEDRRAEITSIMCTSVISPSYVRDLEKELREKVDANSFKAKADDIIDNTEDNSQVSISDEEIQNVYDSI